MSFPSKWTHLRMEPEVVSEHTNSPDFSYSMYICGIYTEYDLQYLGVQRRAIVSCFHSSFYFRLCCKMFHPRVLSSQRIRSKMWYEHQTCWRAEAARQYKHAHRYNIHCRVRREANSTTKTRISLSPQLQTQSSITGDIFWGTRNWMEYYYDYTFFGVIEFGLTPLSVHRFLSRHVLAKKELTKELLTSL